MSKVPFITKRGWEVVAVHHLTTKCGMEYGEAAEWAQRAIKKHGWEKVMQEAEKIEARDNNTKERK